MTEHQQRTRADARPASRGRVRAVLSAGAVLGLGAVGTLAAWTDSATATTGQFSTAPGQHIEISLNGSPTPSTFEGLNVSGLKPDESKAAILAVSNTGAGPFAYTSTLQAAGPEVLAENLTVTINRGGALAGTTCTGGTQIASFTLDDAVAQPKDIVASPHELAVDAVDELCVQVQLANPVTKEASNEYVTTKFRFTAVGQD